MNNKTCGECAYFCKDETKCCLLEGRGITYSSFDACKKFMQKKNKPKPTNGDRIRQMSNEELLQHLSLLPCQICPAKKIKGCNKDIWDGSTRCQQNWLNWLNSPAESEVESE